MYTTKSRFKSCNYEVNQTISWKMLSDCQCEEIMATAMELLERSGAKVMSEAALEIFAGGGCLVEGNNVRIPSAKLEWALRSAPSRLTLCNKDGKRAMLLENENVHFGLAGGAEYIVDRESGEPRKITAQDIVDAACLAEKLTNVEFVAAPGRPFDRPDASAPLHALEALLLHTTKPVVMPVCCVRMAKKAVEMAACAAGGAEKLAWNPRLVLSITCDEPRYHTAEAMDAVIYAARERVPFVYSVELEAGHTAPASTAGTLVLTLANFLVAALLAQLVREGAPIIAGGVLSIVDARNGMVPYGAPEAGLLSAGFANLMRYARVPSMCVGGVTDAAASDSQAGVEIAVGLLSASLAGANMVSGAGLLESGKQYSHSLLAISDESMSLMYRIMRSFEVDEDRLACGVYDTVEPGGSYLGEEHTSLFFKSEQFWPNLFTRKRITDWLADGGKPMGQRASEYVETILAQPAAPLVDGETASALREIVAKADIAF